MYIRNARMRVRRNSVLQKRGFLQKNRKSSYRALQFSPDSYEIILPKGVDTFLFTYARDPSRVYDCR